MFDSLYEVINLQIERSALESGGDGLLLLAGSASSARHMAREAGTVFTRRPRLLARFLQSPHCFVASPCFILTGSFRADALFLRLLARAFRLWHFSALRNWVDDY